MGKKFDLKVNSNKSVFLQNVIEGEKAEYQYIQVNNIEFNKENDYANEDSDESIRELANDIKRNGLLHNIVVSYTPEGKYKLLSGERRLKSYQLLLAETGDTKYQTIYALIRKGLSETEEMIILDAANLQARGGMSGEKRYRKASVRFIANLKRQFGISEDEAIALTKQYAGVTDAVIEKNVAIETELHPAILSLLDSGEISKQQAYEYSRLDEDFQKIIGEKLTEAQNAGEKELRETNNTLSDSAKQIRNLEDSISKKKEDLREIKKDQRKDYNPEIKEVLSKQESVEKKKIKELKKELEEKKEKIKQLSPRSSTHQYSFSVAQISKLSSSLSSLIKDLPVSQLSDKEKEDIRKELEKEQKKLEEYINNNF